MIDSVLALEGEGQIGFIEVIGNDIIQNFKKLDWHYCCRRGIALILRGLLISSTKPITI